MKVVIMAGGKGTRISSVASDIPKPMIKIEGIQTSIMRFQMKMFRTSAIVIFSRIAKKWCHLLNVMLCAQLNI